MHKYRETAQLCALLLLVALLGGCGNSDESGPNSADDSAPAPANPTASFLPAANPATHGCGGRGALKATLYGALAGEIEWHSADMQCAGMPRPGGAGARLRFAGNVGDDAMQLAFIIALPDLGRGGDGAGFTSNVTVIDEGNSRFFSTTNLDTCWTDVEVQWAIDDSPNRYRIDGILYCISPLPEVNGEGSITMPELRFSGQLDWGSK